jgi:hypothetical protein
MASLHPEVSTNVAYMCPEKKNTHQNSDILDPNRGDVLELPDLSDGDHHTQHTQHTHNTYYTHHTPHTHHTHHIHHTNHTC